MLENPPLRLGVLGGTFDPMHVAHVAAADEVLRALTLDRVIFVPAGRPWQKDRYSDAEDRFMMTSLGAAGHPRFAVSRIEIDRRGPTYTLDTMIALREFYGGPTELFFIAGADAVLQLGTWKGIEKLGGYCEIVAVARRGSDLEGFEAREDRPRVRVVEMEPIDISATDIRKRVREGRSIEGMVAPPVAHYIKERRLYLDSERASA